MNVKDGMYVEKRRFKTQFHHYPIIYVEFLSVTFSIVEISKTFIGYHLDYFFALYIQRLQIFAWLIY